MKYLKRLKNELSELTKELGGEIYDAPPSNSTNRARLLQSLVRVVKHVLEADRASDGWVEPSIRGAWSTYIVELEAWVNRAPTIPFHDGWEPSRTGCQVNPKIGQVYEVIFHAMNLQELLTLRNALILHVGQPQVTGLVRNHLLEAIMLAEIDLENAIETPTPIKKVVEKSEARA